MAPRKKYARPLKKKKPTRKSATATIIENPGASTRKSATIIENSQPSTRKSATVTINENRRSSTRKAATVTITENPRSSTRKSATVTITENPRSSTRKSATVTITENPRSSTRKSATVTITENPRPSTRKAAKRAECNEFTICKRCRKKMKKEKPPKPKGLKVKLVKFRSPRVRYVGTNSSKVTIKILRTLNDDKSSDQIYKMSSRKLKSGNGRHGRHGPKSVSTSTTPPRTRSSKKRNKTIVGDCDNILISDDAIDKYISMMERDAKNSAAYGLSGDAPVFDPREFVASTPRSSPKRKKVDMVLTSNTTNQTGEESVDSVALASSTDSDDCTINSGATYAKRRNVK